MADYDTLQARLARIAEEEAVLREARKETEHELAQAKLDRPYSGPVFDADGNPVSGADATAEAIDSAIEGASASASAAGEEQ